MTEKYVPNIDAAKPVSGEPEVPVQDNPYTQIYEVQKGDSLSKIAREFYGDPMMYPTIFEANRDILDDPDRIQPGQKLRIP